jgi:hypothetical protein
MALPTTPAKSFLQMQDLIKLHRMRAFRDHLYGRAGPRDLLGGDAVQQHLPEGDLFWQNR